MTLSTVKVETVAETEERRSRFICHLLPYASFRERLEELRKEHPKANHHVTAFRYMDENDRVVEGSRDDGEPSGTSGPPCLKVLQGRGMMDIGVVVIRYFGGVKLGTGGLARAYSGAVGAALTEAQTLPWVQISEATISAGFDDLSLLERMLATAGLEITDRSYTADGVEISLRGERESVARFREEWASRSY